MTFAYCAMGQETENKGVIWNCTTSLNSFLFSLVASVQVTSIITLLYLCFLVLAAVC